VLLPFGTSPSPSLLHKPRRHFDVHDRAHHGHPHAPYLVYVCLAIRIEAVAFGWEESVSFVLRLLFVLFYLSFHY